MTLNDTVTMRTRMLLSANGRGLAGLARHLDISRPSLSHRLRGTVGWSISEVEGIARYYGESVTWVIGAEDRMPQIRPTSLTPPYVLGRSHGHLRAVVGVPA